MAQKLARLRIFSDEAGDQITTVCGSPGAQPSMRPII
jgi:hypothetical protein